MSFIKIKHLWPILPIGILIAAATWTMFAPFPVWGHSAGLDATRLFELDRGLRAGELYPRWAADMYFGRGSPLLSMYAPLAYYVAEIFHLAGLGLALSMKLSYLAAAALAAAGMFLLARRHTGAPAGIAAAALYVLAPYFLSDLYARAAAAELYGFGIAPWIFFFLARYQDHRRTRDLGAAAFAFGFLGFAHNISALIYSPLILLYILCVFPARDWPKGIFVIAVGLALSAFFWLPALDLKSAVQSEKHLTTGYFSFSRHFVPFADLFIPRWGYDAPGAAEGVNMSEQLGLVHWAALALATAVLVRVKEARKEFGTFLAMGLIALFFTQSISSFFWNHVPLLKFVQFPWRFLSPATFAATALSAALFVPVRKRFGASGQTALMAALCGAGFLAYYGYARANYLLLEMPSLQYRMFTRQGAEAVSGNPEFITFDEFMNTDNVLQAGLTGMASDDFLPVTVGQKPTSRAPQPFSILGGAGTLHDQKSDFNRHTAEVIAESPVILDLAVFDFPGFEARVDRRSVPIQPRPNLGTILFKTPEGKHRVEVSYEGAFIHKFSDMLSLIGLLIALRMIFSPSKIDMRAKTWRPPQS